MSEDYNYKLEDHLSGLLNCEQLSGNWVSAGGKVCWESRCLLGRG